MENYVTFYVINFGALTFGRLDNAVFGNQLGSALDRLRAFPAVEKWLMMHTGVTVTVTDEGATTPRFD